ncbi:MAG: hypothetical protein KAS32_13685 [Candidatus Peribacteraceae bacterium]|nr:hypothetical protein [Candidatus Peribacteraceae bacterium]
MSDHDILIELRTMAKETNKDIKEMKRTLHGNGREGLCGVVVKHNEQITTLFKTHKNDLQDLKDQKKSDLKVLGLVLALCALALAALQIFLP